MERFYVLALIFALISLSLLSYDFLCLAESLRGINNYIYDSHLKQCAVCLHCAIGCAALLAVALRDIGDENAKF